MITRPLREKAAYQNMRIINQIRREAHAKIILMGDFIDDPINSSFKKVLKTKEKKEAVNKNDLYNPFERMFKKTLFHKFETASAYLIKL